MNTVRNFKVRVCDYTESQPILRKRIQTLSDGPGLLFALSGENGNDRVTPRFRQSDPEPFLADEWLE
ncbi:MAG: hypothetical protein KGS60_01115 [Verrucomicrobia bacterium]|nr:hypothetical protein [Verrucomicrobiota bacterium]